MQDLLDCLDMLLAVEKAADVRPHLGALVSRRMGQVRAWGVIQGRAGGGAALPRDSWCVCVGGGAPIPLLPPTPPPHRQPPRA